MTDKKSTWLRTSNDFFRELKVTVKEIEIWDVSVPKSTPSVNKLAMKIFGK